ncbi:MAG TPA: energy transducer TonB [Vicinamibacterales bacterium]|nr:energy transducer TonB [Vicinamibacterales bacterium]
MKLLITAILVVVVSGGAAAQDRAFAPSSVAVPREPSGMTTARELYAAARYDEALSVLDALRAADRPAGADLKSIEQYRAFCLLALGRADEAQAAIGAVVTADPFYQPREEEVAPRVRAMFTEVRRRLLPEIAGARYAAAKQTYDQKAHAEAERQFREVVALVDDPHMEGRLADLRLLASGFVELASAAAAAAAAAPEAPRPEPPPPAAPAAPPVPRIYSSEDAGVVAPVSVRQDLPLVPSAITATVRAQGLLEIVIDEQGRVASMTLRSRVHPVYDTMLLNAARDWKYKPATLDGTPVQFRKLIQFNVRR